MKSAILTIAIATAATVATLVSHAAEWSIAATIDPITDQLVYHAWALGSEISCRTGSYCPKLAIRITPTEYDETKHRMRFAPDVYIWSPAIKRRTETAAVDITMRYDTDPPTIATWTGSDNKCALFCADPTNTFRQLRSAKKIALRFQADREQTTVIALDGLSASLAKIQTDYLRRIGKYKEPRQPKAPRCKKCKGEGTIVGWTTCPNCNGKRCKKCIRSIMTGKIREKIPCPVCQKDAAQKRKEGFGSSTATYAPHGYYKAQRAQIRNQIFADVHAKNDALINDYYKDKETWLNAKRNDSHEKQVRGPVKETMK